MSKTLIKNAYVLSFDPDVGDIDGGDILIDGTTIAAVGRGLEAGGAEVVDATGMVAIPGMVDGHRHVWQSAIRGVGSTFALGDYFGTVLGALAPLYKPDDVYAGNRYGGLEALNAGITTLLDWCHIIQSPEHADAALEGLRASGVRAVFAYGPPVGLSVEDWFMNSELTHPEDVRRFRSEQLPDDGPEQRITMALALRGPGMATVDVTEHDFNLARELGVPMTIHAGEPEYHHQANTIVALHERGLLGPDVNYAHGNQFSERDLELIVESGGSITASPAVELEMGLGFPIVGRFLDAGGRPSLSVDTIAATGSDLFTQMRVAFAAERMRVAQPTIDADKAVSGVELAPRDFLSFATIDGARAWNLEDRIGSLTPGKQADVVLLSTDGMNAAPLNDPAVTAVLSMDTANVDTVFVAGEAVKRDGAMTGDGPAEARRLVQESRQRLFSAAGLGKTLGPVWD